VVEQGGQKATPGENLSYSGRASSFKLGCLVVMSVVCNTLLESKTSPFLPFMIVFFCFEEKFVSKRLLMNQTSES
jgi:hypothetical protein